MSTGWESLPGTFPWPPMNGQVVSPMFTGALDIRWDDPSLVATGVVPNLVQATGYIIILGTPATLVDAVGTVMVAGAPAAGETLSIGSYTLTAVAGARTPGANDFDASLPTTGAIAADLANAINDAANAIQGYVVASVVGSTITLAPADEGAAGNLVTLVTTSDWLLLSGDTLEGGTDADTLTIGGVLVLTAVIGARTPGGNDFSADGNTFDIANSVSAALNDALNVFAGAVTATAEFGKVSLTAVPVGYKGNAISLACSDSDVFTLSGSYLEDGDGDDVCKGQSNATWTIVGVNVYRSDNGERGPYVRLNKFPVGSMFYRDMTDITHIEDEVVSWEGAWVSKGDTANDRTWVFRTVMAPIVKPIATPPAGVATRLTATPANSPRDVTVTIGGEVVDVDDVFGPNGEITLINRPTFNPITEKSVPAVLPNLDGSTPVTVSYWYARNVAGAGLDAERTTQMCYRLTTVAIDAESPTGYSETPLAYSPPLFLSNVETMDWIWREAVRRNQWILEQGGERVKLFKRKVSGIPCPCRVDERTMEYQQQPDARCLTCMGVGFVGGYDGPISIIVGPDDAERRVAQTPNGRKLEHTYEVWIGPSPTVTQRDFLVKQTGERYSIGPVRRPAHRGLPLQQHFNLAYLSEGDIRYLVPVTGMTELPWPETRVTDLPTPCEDAPPYPVGFEPGSAPMETNSANVPEGRQLRGRTPVWQNLTRG